MGLLLASRIPMLATVALSCVIGCGSSSPSGGEGGSEPEDCADDEREREDGTCVPVGVPAGECGDGFESDGLGGCRAILPLEPCPPGQVGLPGDTACAPLAPCPEGTWDFVPDGANVVYVDGAYTGGDSDGSKYKPFVSVGVAVGAAGPGDTVAIADGIYDGNVLILDPITLLGRCPDAVTLRGDATTQATLLIVDEPSRGTVVRGLSITGPVAALGLAATDATFEEVRIHDTGGRGVDVISQVAPTSATLRRVLVEGAKDVGIFAVGATLVLDGTTVRGSLPNATGSLGVGLFARAGDGALALAIPSVVHAERSVVEGHFGAGISLSGGELVATRSVVRDIAPQAADGEDGFGVFAIEDPTVSLPSVISLDRVVVERTFAGGVVMQEGQLDATRLTVVDVGPNQATQAFGAGVAFQLGPAGGATGTLTDSTVVRAHGQGVFVAASEAIVERTYVRDTLPYDAEAAFGDGVLVAAFDEQASLAVHGSRVDNSVRAGVASFGAAVSVGETLMVCNSIDLNGQDLGGTSSFVDEGGNVCRCDGVDHACQLQGAALLPPTPP